MSNYHRDWERLGRGIRDTVKQVANSREFQELKKTFSENRTAEIRKTDTDSLYAKPTRLVVGGLFKALLGGPLACVGFLLASIPFFYDAVVGSATEPVEVSVFLVLLSMCVGGLVTWNGIDNILTAFRFRKYRKALGDKTQLPLSKLARAVGRTEAFVRKDLQKMLKKGLFIEGRLNNEQTWLLTSNEAWRLFEESRLQLEQRRKEQQTPPAPEPSPADPKLQEVLRRGDEFIAQIRKCNDDIPGDEISAKIDRMEQVVRRIFRRAKDHPEVVPDLKKLMDYYLPTTVKLLTAYAEMDSQPAQGENIQTSKREIEATLDTINAAFEKLLDELYQDTALDISSDISVLQTLLAQEGLTGSDFTEPNNP